MHPRTVEEIYADFSARRDAIVVALTDDVEKFWHECDPSKENLCLYGACARPNGPRIGGLRREHSAGQADGTWRVGLPVEEVPPELPEPALGVNFARDGMAVRRGCLG